MSAAERCNVVYRIGGWTVDAGCQTACRGIEERRLNPRELAVLLHLAEAAPAFASTDELLSWAWPGTLVVDNALHQVIRRLRKTLEYDAGEPRLIETLPRRGYRLTVPVSRVMPNHFSVIVDPIRPLDDEVRLCATLRDEIVCRASRIARLRVLLDGASPHTAASTARLTGTVGAQPDRTYRVRMQLMAVADGGILWADSFDINGNDDFRAPVAIAEAVARVLKVLLTERLFAAIGTRGGDAIRAHLRGSVELGRANPDAFEQAIGFFNQAIELDPQLAVAWIGKAFAQLHYSNYGRMERRKAWEAARVGTRRALALDPCLPAAQLMMADLELYDGEFEAAHQRMCELRHSNLLHAGVVQHLAICGDLEGALEVIERLIDADRGGTWPQYLRIMVLWLARRYGEALRHADAMLAVVPDDQRALAERSRVLASMGRLEEALASRVTHGDALRLTFRHGGRTALLQEILEFACRIEHGRTSLHPEHAWRYYVEAYAALGRPEDCVRWLARGYEIDPWEFLWWRQMPHPGMPEVRRHPCFRNLMAQTVGFPPTCPAADMD